MIKKQLDELFPELTLNTNSRVRKKCLVVYLRKKGYRREEVAELLRIDEDTVTNYTKKYDESGLQGLIGGKLSPTQKPIGAVYRAAKGTL
jgi:transposase